MKRFYLSVALICMALFCRAQSNPIDDMFDRYSEKPGFTVVSISSKMLSMFADKEAVNKEADDIISKLKSIKILSVEDSLLNKNLNFYSELSKKLDLTVYEELMVVKDSRDITRFLVRQNGQNISELLIITGGPGGNSLISIKGDLNLKNISGLSKNMNIDGLMDLDKLDQQKAKKQK